MASFGNYLPSFYNIYFSNGSSHYIFNTWHGNLVSVEEAVFDSLRNKTTSCIQADLFEKLAKLGFLTTEKNEFQKVLEENFNHQDLIYKSNFSICISPTLKCNASC